MSAMGKGARLSTTGLPKSFYAEVHSPNSARQSRTRLGLGHSKLAGAAGVASCLMSRSTPFASRPSCVNKDPSLVPRPGRYLGNGCGRGGLVRAYRLSRARSRFNTSQPGYWDAGRRSTPATLRAEVGAAPADDGRAPPSPGKQRKLLRRDREKRQPGSSSVTSWQWIRAKRP